VNLNGRIFFIARPKERKGPNKATDNVSRALYQLFDSKWSMVVV